jgi:hypothetical protein
MQVGVSSSSLGYVILKPPTGIELIGTAEDDAQLETLKDVVARHLVRFGANDQLTVSWTP